MLEQHSLPLSLDPSSLPRDEIPRLALRSPARNRDAQRAVGPDSEDVSTGARGAHELDSIGRWRWRGRWLRDHLRCRRWRRAGIVASVSTIEKGKTQLHAAERNHTSVTLHRLTESAPAASWRG